MFGGYKSIMDGPFYGDFHYLDLNKLDGWHTLPSYPMVKAARKEPLCCHHATFVQGNMLYYFSGESLMSAFDLVKEK